MLTFGLGELVRRRRTRWGRTQHRVPASAQNRCPVDAEQLAGLLGRGHLLERREVFGDHGFDRGSVSALSESCSKSACTFPVISNAVRVRSSPAEIGKASCKERVCQSV